MAQGNLGAATGNAFLRNLVDAVPEKGLRFPGLRLVRVAGSSLPPSLLEAALERLTPNLASVYGLFEIGFVTFGGAADLRRVPESVGKVVAGVEAELTDEGGAPVAAGTAGLLRLRRAGMPQAYFRNPEATAKAFRGGWFHTGDYARLDAEGMLHIGGRADDKMIAAAGAHMAPVDHEFLGAQARQTRLGVNALRRAQ